MLALIPFQPDTLLKIGKKRTTTHSDTGGSGIGLMTVFELIKKYNASFLIDESINNEFFAKNVSVVFDGLCEYRIKSTRPEIIKYCSDRKNIKLL